MLAGSLASDSNSISNCGKETNAIPVLLAVAGSCWATTCPCFSHPPHPLPTASMSVCLLGWNRSVDETIRHSLQVCMEYMRTRLALCAIAVQFNYVQLIPIILSLSLWSLALWAMHNTHTHTHELLAPSSDSSAFFNIFSLLRLPSGSSLCQSFVPCCWCPPRSLLASPHSFLFFS